MPVTRVNQKQQGFSLPEVLCAVALFAIVMVALLGYHRALQQGFYAQWQFRHLWRLAIEITEPQPLEAPIEWKVNRQQTTTAGCVSITVNITSPVGRTGQMSRLHCPQEKKSQE